MEDQNVTKPSLELSNGNTAQLASVWYNLLLSKCSVRTKNVLQAYRDTFDNDDSYLLALMNISRKEVKSFRNCGRLTADEIICLVKQLRNNVEYNGDLAVSSPEIHLPSNIDLIFPLLCQKLETLSVRARNAISLFLQENDNSVSRFYATVTSPSFQASTIKNVGRGTVPEVCSFIESAISYINAFNDEQAVDTLLNDYSTPKLSSILIPLESQAYIEQLQEELGHFPLFAAVSAYLEGLEFEKKTIIENCIRVHDGQQVADRNDIGNTLGITHERVRQKRNKILEDLAVYFAGIRKAGFIKDNPYRYLMTHVNEDINNAEGTDFSLNFVSFVLSSTFDSVKVVGNIHKALTNAFYDEYNVSLVPAELSSYFDFDAFEEFISQKMEEKRINEEKVDLRACMSQFYKIQYYEDYQNDIETACRSILYISFPVEVDMGKIFFSANMRKSDFLIVEDILRASGKPMTLDEIYEEFLYQYPERSVEYSAFRGTIGHNENIIPVGRSSTYALKEWDITVNRGGTIRTFVDEYLHSLETPIADVDSICEYVRQFRPDTENNSITSNLAQEKNQKYAFYKKDEVRYIGYRQYEYDECYVLLDLSRVAKRTTDESMALLKEFIETHYHYPIHNLEDEEEKRLYRFVDNMRSFHNRGMMNEDVARQWVEFERKYSPYRLRRKEVEAIETILLALQNTQFDTVLPEGFSSFKDFEKSIIDGCIASMKKKRRTNVQDNLG